MQLEFESLAALEKWWADFWTRPQGEKAPVDLGDVTVKWDSREVWDVIE